MSARTVTVATTAAPLQVDLTVGPHRYPGDEAVADGGTDQGPTPFEFLASGLGACTAATLKLYAARKAWPLTGVRVEVDQLKGPEQHRFVRRITLEGPLDAEQRARLLDIANRCPVHRALTGQIVIDSSLTA